MSFATKDAFGNTVYSPCAVGADPTYRVVYDTTTTGNVSAIDLLTINLPASNTNMARLKRWGVQVRQSTTTSTGLIIAQLVKRSVLDTPQTTAATPTIFKMDPADPSPVAVVTINTGAPSATGTAAGVVDQIIINQGTALAGGDVQRAFSTAGDKAPVLRTGGAAAATGDQFAIALVSGAATLTTGAAITLTLEWEECPLQAVVPPVGG